MLASRGRSVNINQVLAARFHQKLGPTWLDVPWLELLTTTKAAIMDSTRATLVEVEASLHPHPIRRYTEIQEKVRKMIEVDVDSVIRKNTKILWNCQVSIAWSIEGEVRDYLSKAYAKAAEYSGVGSASLSKVRTVWID